MYGSPPGELFLSPIIPLVELKEKKMNRFFMRIVKVSWSSLFSTVQLKENRR
jgi:hypothetical protein